MSIFRQAHGHGGERTRLLGVLAVVLALTLVVFLAERGVFARFGGAAGNGVGVLPDTTLDDDPDARMLVITSVRSDGAAARAGLQAGDDIAAIDGHAVRTLADLRAAVTEEHGNPRLALLVQRGDTRRTVLLDRTGRQDIAATGLRNGAENPAD